MSKEPSNLPPSVRLCNAGIVAINVTVNGREIRREIGSAATTTYHSITCHSISVEGCRWSAEPAMLSEYCTVASQSHIVTVAVESQFTGTKSVLAVAVAIVRVCCCSYCYCLGLLGAN